MHDTTTGCGPGPAGTCSRPRRFTPSLANATTGVRPGHSSSPGGSAATGSKEPAATPGLRAQQTPAIGAAHRLLPHPPLCGPSGREQEPGPGTRGITRLCTPGSWRASRAPRGGQPAGSRKRRLARAALEAVRVSDSGWGVPRRAASHPWQAAPVPMPWHVPVLPGAFLSAGARPAAAAACIWDL